MKECFIGIGKCSHFYIYIVFSIIFKVIKFCLKEKELNEKDDKTGLLILSISKYFGFSIFGILFYCIFPNNVNQSQKNNQKIKNEFEYKYKQKKINIKTKDFIMVSIICLFYVIFLESIQLLKFFDFNELFIWSFDSFSMLIIMQFYYPKKMYKH